MQLTNRDRRGLTWARSLARARLTAAKRLRKHSPRQQAVLPPREVEVLTALLDLKQLAAGKLLENGSAPAEAGIAT